MSNIKFRLVGGLHKYYYECTICVIHKGKDRGLPCITQRRRWVFKSKGADSNRMSISLSVLLSETSKAGGGGACLKPPQPPSNDRSVIVCIMHVF